MLLLTHIIIALASIVVTTYGYVAPTQAKLRLSYVLAGMTFATGTVLTFLNPSHLVPACISGIIYLSVVSVGIYYARLKLLAHDV